MLSSGDPDAATAWQEIFTSPIGDAITGAVDNDLVRGVMATDALIGTFARTDDPSLVQNVCFLYHLIGGGTGDWDVPIGGMGAVSGALAAAASGHGAEIVTGADVHAITPTVRCTTATSGTEHRIQRGRCWPASPPPCWRGCSVNRSRRRRRALRSRST